MSDRVSEVMEPVPGEPSKNPKGDLGVRTISAIVMIAVTAAAFWADGWVLLAFLALVGALLLHEFWSLVNAFVAGLVGRIGWMLFGLIYIGLAIAMVLNLTLAFFGPTLFWAVIGSVIATDIGAYFAGRSIGGPKIAPRISPSKTWAGLIGGMFCAAIVFPFIYRMQENAPPYELVGGLWIIGAGIAIVAQAGDFFESWMKRRAGVKDSGKLIPGHGGLLDRVDGMVAVLFVIGIFYIVKQ
jgi:phosphatidate cytidylyltransferase